jgi:hypothetical protein
MAIWLMAPDERVLVVGRPSLASVWPRYLLTLGLYGFWHRRRVSVLTSKGVMLGKGILSRQETVDPDPFHQRRHIRTQGSVGIV